MAVLSFSVVRAVDENSTIVIHGDKGGVRLESDQWWSAARKGEWTPQRVDVGDLPGEPRTLPGNSPGGYFGSGTWYLARAIREALDDGVRDALAPAATFVDGWRNQRVLDAGRKSASSDGAWSPA